MHSIFLARVEIVAISPVTKNCRAHRAIVPPGLEAGADRRREVADEWLLGVRRVSVTCEGTVRRLTAPPAEARRALDDCVDAADREAVHMGERRAVDSLWPFAFRPVLLHVPPLRARIACG